MHKSLLSLTVFSVISFTAIPAFAQLEPNYNSSDPRATTAWYSPSDAAAVKADLDFVTGMHPHHAGALTMSEEYLNDKGATNVKLKQLARGIIHNQSFEIKMLQEIRNFRNLSIDKQGKFMNLSVSATKDMAQKEQFTRKPMPGWMDNNGSADVSVRDVQFAKAMIIHHQGALDMAHDYLNDKNATNGYLRLMCLDILLDQKQEIDFMQSIINAYAGNADDVKIDPSMIHGMEGMSHGGHGGHHGHGTKATQKKHVHVTHTKKKQASASQKLKPLQVHDVQEHHHHH